MKFGMGLVLLGVGFLVIAWGSLHVPENAASDPTVGVAMTWLVVTYFFHTVGELALSPVGLSSVTKLSPPRLVGQMMGIWFMGTALGNLIAGLVAGQFERLPLVQLFGAVGALAIGSGLYIGGGLGPGPRDGIMTGLAQRGIPVWRARTSIEVTVLIDIM